MHSKVFHLLRLCGVMGVACGLLGSCQTGPDLLVIEKFHSASRVRGEDYPDVSGVILLDRHEVSFSFSTKKRRPFSTVLHLRRIQIFKEGAKEFAKVKVAEDLHRPILRIHGRVYKKDGTTVTMDPEAFFQTDRFSPGSPAHRLYSEKGFTVFKVPNVEVGDVLEIATLRVIRDARWMQPIAVGGKLPTLRGEVIIDHPKAFDIAFRVTRLGQVVDVRPERLRVEITDAEKSAKTVPGYRRVFLFRDEPAVFPEPGQPALAALATQVHLQLRSYRFEGKVLRGFQGWDDVAAWYSALTAWQQKPDKMVLEKIGAWRNLLDGKKEALELVQRFVQDEVDDVPTFGHLAALRSRAPSDVLKYRVGDSKDQAVLVQQMLRALGIQSVPVLVSRLGSMAQVPDLPTPAPFNHVLVAIPSGGYYQFIDPSTDFLSTGALPARLQGQRAVMVHGAKGELITLPIDAIEKNSLRRIMDLELSKQGVLFGKITLQAEGLDAAELRLWVAHRDSMGQKALLNKIFPGMKSMIQFETIKALNLEKVDSPLTIEMVLRPTPLAKRQGAALHIDMVDLLGAPWPWSYREKRETPVLLSHIGTQRYELQLKLPEGLGLAEGAADWSSFSFALEIEESRRVANGVLFIERVMKQGVLKIDADRYEDAVVPAQALRAREKVPLIFIPGGDRGSDYGEVPF